MAKYITKKKNNKVLLTRPFRKIYIYLQVTEAVLDRLEQGRHGGEQRWL